MAARQTLTLNDIRNAIVERAAAFRCVTEYEPAGGPGDKVFPPTYEGGKYAVEWRMVTDQKVDGDNEQGVARKRVSCVLLDSVQSQANRCEQALLEAHRMKRIRLPLLVTRFDDKRLLKKFVITSLDASHRAADAVFRDSMFKGTMFRQSEKGRILDFADIRNATGLFGLNPVGLLLGLWDSTGPRGGAGAKFSRALVSEIVGYHVLPGVKTSSRLDHAHIVKDAGPLFRRPDGSWTLDSNEAIDVHGKKVLYAAKNGKDVLYDPKRDNGSIPDQGRPSTANHGNVTPDFAYYRDANKTIVKDRNGEPVHVGGFTISKAVQTTVLSLATLRRLRFPLGDASESDATVDVLAQTVLVALGLTASVLVREDGADLRSRCHLVPTTEFSWEILHGAGAPRRRFTLDGEQAISLLNEAVKRATKAGLPWDGEIRLTPSPQLLELVRRSQQLSGMERGDVN